MNTENIIDINVTNWITIVVMVAVGFAVIAMLTQGVRAVRNAQVSGS